MTLKINGTSGSVSLDAPSDTSPSGSDITLTLPTSAGSAEQFLKNSGTAGELEFSNMVETSTGIDVNGDVSLDDNDKILAGTGDDLEIYHDGSNSYIHDNGTGELNLCMESGSKLVIQSGTSGNHLAEFNHEGAAELFHNGTQKFATTSNGTSVGDSSSTYNEIANVNQAAKMHISGGGSGSGNIEVFGATHAHNSKEIHMNTDGSLRFKIASNGRINAQVIYGTPLSGTTRDVYIEDGGQLGYISSVRDSKTNINLLSNVDWIYQLQPSSFNYKLTDQEGAYTGEVNPELEYGLIAEDVEPVAPELCFYDEVDGEQELRGVHYKKLIVPMLKALQAANTKITALETKVAALEAAE